MPSVTAVADAYRRALAAFETVITINHDGSTYTARGRIYNETSAGLTDAIEQGRLKAIILKEDLAIVPERGDLLEVAGHAYVVSAVDDATRRVGGLTIAYEVTL
jgi:hypothetical protein